MAKDSDSGNFGTVSFELATDSDPVARQYFKAAMALKGFAD